MGGGCVEKPKNKQIRFSQQFPAWQGSPKSCACSAQAQPLGAKSQQAAPAPCRHSLLGIPPQGGFRPRGGIHPSLGRKCALAGGRATKKTTWNAASAMRIPSQGRKPRLSEPRSETAISRPGRECIFALSQHFVSTFQHCAGPF